MKACNAATAQLRTCCLECVQARVGCDEPVFAAPLASPFSAADARIRSPVSYCGGAVARGTRAGARSRESNAFERTPPRHPLLFKMRTTMPTNVARLAVKAQATKSKAAAKTAPKGAGAGRTLWLPNTVRAALQARAAARASPRA